MKTQLITTGIWDDGRTGVFTATPVGGKSYFGGVVHGSEGVAEKIKVFDGISQAKTFCQNRLDIFKYSRLLTSVARIKYRVKKTGNSIPHSMRFTIFVQAPIK